MTISGWTSPSDALMRILLATTEEGDGCMVWDGYLDRKGHGSTMHHGRKIGTHRLVYMLYHGITGLRTDEFVCHSCDNPPCVNPEHLWLGDTTSNMRDCVAKGRHGSQKSPV